ncbi:hypothetical protein TrCOL_g8149 [Triparma columacea]|uniref:Uncharacterized protein n=1 Tax=Triparma columacea TaxID=722753 RepID=A0A9W7G1N5_9STRA|nr:hypothetical protein TrCOL_g8149 [Triparma columacea]
MDNRRHSIHNNAPNSLNRDSSSRRGSELPTLTPEQQTQLDIKLKTAQIQHQISGGTGTKGDSLSRISRKNSQTRQMGGGEGGLDESGSANNDNANNNNNNNNNNNIREVIKSAGLVFSEKGEHQFVLSKPKIMPIKSKVTEKLEEQMKEAGDS